MRMSSTEFLSLTHPVDTHRWELHVTGKMTGGGGSLFGGVGLAAGIVALEQASERPVVWATGQYLGLLQQPVTLDLEVRLPAIGRGTTQGRAVGHLGEREIITVFGAMGARDEPASGVWLKAPQAPPPEDCELLPERHEFEALHDHVEVRLARGMFGFAAIGEPSGDGSSMFWARMPEVANDPGTLAIIADYMPASLGNAFGRQMHCTSLDNTIRIANRVPTDWVLCENHMEFVGDGFGYGRMNMWSQDGVLLATASQSIIVRTPKPDRA